MLRRTCYFSQVEELSFSNTGNWKMSRRSSQTTMVYDSRESHVYPEGSLLFSLTAESPTETKPNISFTTHDDLRTDGLAKESSEQPIALDSVAAPLATTEYGFSRSGPMAEAAKRLYTRQDIPVYKSIPLPDSATKFFIPNDESIDLDQASEDAELSLHDYLRLDGSDAQLNDAPVDGTDTDVTGQKEGHEEIQLEHITLMEVTGQEEDHNECQPENIIPPQEENHNDVEDITLQLVTGQKQDQNECQPENFTFPSVTDQKETHNDCQSEHIAVPGAISQEEDHNECQPEHITLPMVTGQEDDHNEYQSEDIPVPVWKCQSPIDIFTGDARFNQDLCEEPFSITYPRHLQHSSSLMNTGSTWKINVACDHYYIKGGPLVDQYRLNQVHGHWGETDHDGSEHCLDGCAYSGELHFVHWNQEKYRDIDEALNYEDGLTVLGVFVKVGQHNEELAKVTASLDEMKYAGSETGIDKLKLDLFRLVPEDYLKYWTYSGSLTTPPYTECVTWIVFRDPIEVSSEQIQAMRQLFTNKQDELNNTDSDDHCHRCQKNWRPGQKWTQIPMVSASFRIESPGHQQSPIDICSESSVFHWHQPAKPLEMHYPSGIRGASKLINTGTTWKVLVDDERFWIKGGPLKNDLYTLDQFHGHWGSTTDNGSEHTVDGKPFSGEIHFVHWNRKYGTIQEATQHRDGLSVVGFFLEVGEPHPELAKLTSAVEAIRYAGSETDISDIDFQNFLPDFDDHEYWTYPGSLTTPPYTECVVWIVLKKTMKVSVEQLESMRWLCCYKQTENAPDDPCHGRVLQNYRHVQKLQPHLVNGQRNYTRQAGMITETA